MGSYAQFEAAAYRGSIRRFTWVCGSERVLVEEVIDTIRDRLTPDGPPAPDLSVISFEAGVTYEREIWDTCALVPLGPRLVIVRQADEIKRWDSLADLIDAGRALSESWYVFVSEHVDYPKQADGVLCDHIAALRDASAGQLVRCSKPSEADLFAWVGRQLPGTGKVLASYILARSGSDLQEVKTVCAKAALFDVEPAEWLVDALLREQPAEDFADSLVHLRRDHALGCVANMTGRDMLMAFGLLESRLTLLGILAPAVRQRMTEQDMRSRLGINTVLIKRFRLIAPKYDASRIHRCRQLLTMAEAAWRDGARDGVPEALITLW